jgi:hypothetical protein
MKAAAHERGLALLAAHCASLDPAASTARERLEEALGFELAGMLVHALSAGPPARDGRSGALRTRPVFAA